MGANPVRSGPAEGLNEPLPAWPWVRVIDESPAAVTRTNALVALSPSQPTAIATLSGQSSGRSSGDPADTGHIASSWSGSGGSNPQRHRDDGLHVVADALASGSDGVRASSTKSASSTADRADRQRRLLLAYLPYPLTGLLLDLRG